MEDEIDVVKAIYPEIKGQDGTYWLDIPVKTARSVTVAYNGKRVEICHLPAIRCLFEDRKGYPSDIAPKLVISGGEGWLEGSLRQKWEAELMKLWQETHDQIVFTWIDHLIDVVANIEMAEVDVSDESLFNRLLETEKRTKLQEFEASTWSCGICLNEKSGSESVRIDRCGHVFCKRCLKEYLGRAIDQGEIDLVHCPSIECTEAAVARLDRIQSPADGDLSQFEHEFFQPQLDPSLLASIVSRKQLDRFNSLFERFQFDRYRQIMPERVVECPRESCKTSFLAGDTKLAICPKCQFAFCSICHHSWHGDANSCRSIIGHNVPRADLDDWINNETDSLIRKNLAFKYGRHAIQIAVEEYLSDTLFEKLILSDDSGIVRCPACKMPIQRSEGCNKMTCSRCHTFFCNLCCTVLDKDDPYAHFNDPYSPCYQRLFEGLIK